MAKDRGHYSSQYDVIYDSPEYEALSLDAAAVWNALRHWPFPGTYALGLVQVYREPLAHRAKVPMDRLQPALRELEDANWIVSEGRWIWLRNYLKFDPHYLPENPNHVKGVLNTLAGLPSIALVDRFTDYYRAQRNDRGTPFLPERPASKSKSRKAKLIANQSEFDSQSKPIRLPITEPSDSNPVAVAVAVAGTGAQTKTNERTEQHPVRLPNPAIGPGDVDRLCREGWRLVKAIADKTGIEAGTVVSQASTGHGKFKGSPKARFETMEHDRLLLTLEDLRSWARRCGAIVDAPVPSPAQAVAAEPEWENLEAHIEAFVTWYRENPEAGTSGGRGGMHGVAFGHWAKGKGLQTDIRDAILRGGLKKLDELKRRAG